MPIQILPARLANQIAAGEVVERPASVVKELVENSLDSAATMIEIEIEKGGHKRILIRDNGSGIPQGELALALSRHSTSKITCLDDLEHIASLGFRGEALASISSVARLVLTSKPADQSEAWQAHCEGRDMAVQINPVAHPNGTSVDVSDLFFNTPARRKFLRAEKTEFTHIDEVIRRIALSRFDVAFTLKHNGKLLRKYPLADNQISKQRRLVAICGKDFEEHGIELNSQYQDFCLTGWLASPDTAKPQPECQYFYVNGRMMRDKLLNHAVRQALEGVVAPDHQLAYVLYFTLDLAQVDVNVHPAKHEVRFHQSRLVHDFIFRALTDALNQYFSASATAEVSKAAPLQELSPVEPNHNYIHSLQTANNEQVRERVKEPFLGASSTFKRNSHYSPQERSKPLGTAGHNYQQLMTANSSQSEPEYSNKVAGESALPGSAQTATSNWLQVNPQQILVADDSHFYLLDISQLAKVQLARLFENGLPVSQPLLMPIALEADAPLLAQAENLQQALMQNCIEITWQNKRIILRKIPAGMRHYNWVPIIESLLEVSEHSALAIKQKLIESLSQQLTDFSKMQISSLWQEYCHYCEHSPSLASIAKKIPLQAWLTHHA